MADLDRELIAERAEARARRLALASAIWAARGIDDLSGGRTVQAELKGLAQDLRGVGDDAVAITLEAAADALSCLEAIAGADEPPHYGRKILVLDDSEVTADLVALALEGVGCVVAASTTVQECIQRFGEFEPDALIIEPAHPDLLSNGGTESLLSNLESQVLPVIFFSVDPLEARSDQAEVFHADACIAKDQGLTAMLTQVDQVLSGIIW